MPLHATPRTNKFAPTSQTTPLFLTRFFIYLLCYYKNMTIQESITDKLNSAFSPEHLEVINESFMHNVPEGSESHFKVVIVCDDFEGKMLIARHRLVNKILEDELQKDRSDGGIHALALHTMTMEEWFDKGKAPDSPECLGGGK